MIKKILFTSFIILQFQLLNSQNECVAVNSSIWDVTWQSCQTKPNPNSTKGNTHWILYDLRKIFDLSSTWIWNVNKASELNSGFKNVIIDYSLNQTNWSTLGSFEFVKGTGEANYQGFKGPDFNKKKARYILLTAVDNWGDPSCYGLSEVRFNLTEPSDIQEVNMEIPPTLYALDLSDDGNGTARSSISKSLYAKNESITLTAVGNSDYEFQGWSGDITSTENPLNVSIESHMQITANFIQEALLNCQDGELTPTGNISNSDYIAKSRITSSGIILNGSDITFQAGSTIELLSGFQIESGSVFSAIIKDCLNE